MNWVIATGNAHKLAEVSEVLSPCGVTCVRPADIGVSLDPEEWGETFAVNAAIKAVAFALETGRTCLADDSGLEVDALGGAPGVHSARWAGTHGDDAANNTKLVRALADIPSTERSARFRCVIAVAFPRQDAPPGTPEKRMADIVAGEAALVDGLFVVTFDGACEGTVSEAAVGAHGFGYDPHFVVSDGRHMAELSSAEKHAISHRGAALGKLTEWLRAGR